MFILDLLKKALELEPQAKFFSSSTEFIIDATGTAHVLEANHVEPNGLWVEDLPLKDYVLADFAYCLKCLKTLKEMDVFYCGFESIYALEEIWEESRRFQGKVNANLENQERWLISSTASKLEELIARVREFKDEEWFLLPVAAERTLQEAKIMLTELIRWERSLEQQKFLHVSLSGILQKQFKFDLNFGDFEDAIWTWASVSKPNTLRPSFETLSFIRTFKRVESKERVLLQAPREVFNLFKMDYFAEAVIDSTPDEVLETALSLQENGGSLTRFSVALAAAKAI